MSSDQAKAIADIAKDLLDKKDKRIAELEAKLKNSLTTAGVIAKADKQRLIDAAEKAKVQYMGCDTPDQLAERINELETLLRESPEPSAFDPWQLETYNAWHDRVQAALKDE